MRQLLVIFMILATISVTADAKTKPMDDTALSAVAGGVLPGPIHWRGPLPGPIGQPLPINPGGPILISCQVGSGCTTTHLH